MLQSDSIGVSGQVNFKIYDQYGNLKSDDTVKNLVVDSGKKWIARSIGNGPEERMSHLAIGISDTIASALNTTLVSEIARVPLDGAPTTIDNMTSYVATFPPGVGTGQIVEAGIFTPSNVMLCRTAFGIRTKDPLDTMKITWTITIV